MAERVSIQVHVDGKNAVATLKEIKQYVDQLDGKKINIGAGFGGAGGSGAARGVGVRADALTKFFDYGGFSNNSARLLSILKNANKAEKELLKEQEKAVLEQARETRRFYDNEYKQSQMDLMNTINGFANAARFVGKASTATSTFASGIGSAFSGMGSMFHMNIFDTARRYLTAMATRMVTGNLGASISRADIMNTFVPYMTLAGVDSATANSALNRINASILGLPIGLDEAAQRLRRYQMFMGDTEAATNMTIGIQNAIMAGGASEQMKTTAYYQIDRLLSAGKLSTSRQWLALLQGLGVSTRFLAEEMGNAGMTAKEMAAGLTSGEISTEDFLQAVQRLATNPNINRALDIYKNTYESWISNIGFAFKRGNANVLNALSDSLYASTGRTNLDYMKLFRNSVNGVYSNAVTWLGENPSAMGGLATSLLGLGGAVGGINFGGMASSVLGNIGRVVDYVASGINKVSGGKLEDFVSFATTLAAPIGGVFKAVGGGLPAMLGVYDRFKDFNFEGLMDNIATATGEMANLVSGILGGVSDDTMSRLLSYGLVWGKPVGMLANGIGGGIAGIGSLISGYNQGWQNIASGNWGMTGFSSFLHAKGFEDPYQFWKWAGNTASVGGLFGVLPIIGAVAQAASNRDIFNRTYENMYGTDDFTGIHNVVSSANQFNYAIGNAMTERRDAYESLSDIESIQEAIALNESQMAEAYEHGTALVQRRTELSKELAEAEADRDAAMWGGSVLPGMEMQYAAAEERIKRYRPELEEVNAEIKDTSASISQLRAEGQRLNHVYDITIKKTEALTKATETGKFTAEERASYITQLTQATEEINKATDKWIAETYGGMGRVENPAAAYYDASYGKKSTRVDIQTTTKSLNEMGDALGTIYDYMAELPGSPEQRRQIANYVSDMLELGETDKILGFARLINTGDYDNLFGVAEDWAAKEAAEGNMKTATDNLVEMSAAFQDGGEAAYMLSQNSEEVTSSLSTAGAQAEKFGHQMGEAGAAAGQAAGNVGAANSELEQTPGLASAAAGGLDTFAGSAANAAGAAGEAANYIGSVNAILAELEGSHVIDILVNYIQTGTPPDVFSFEGYKFLDTPSGSSSSGSSGGSHTSGTGGWKPNSGSQPFSRGGVVYAADGMFIPHGTDTVPAMLTPGEYVVRRKAAAAFGKAFMDRVNALDIHGAFRALSHRMSVPSTGSFIANNQRTYDNHASVTQNIVTNSQSFTHRRARRWVRALT